MISDVERHHRSTQTAHLVSAGFEVTGGDPIESLCIFCAEFHAGVRARRLNTAYADEKQNWMCSCLDCYAEAVDYYREMWAEYYRDVL